MQQGLKKQLNAGVAVTVIAAASLVAAAPANAQNVGAQPANDPATAEPAFGGDIVVTAQRREERLRDVPISVSALSGSALQNRGIASFSSLTTAVPGLVVTAGGTAIQPAIRGISTSVGVPGAENNIAVYLDGVYQVLPTATNFQLADVERIEVLKGPQGTLFGRNASGGAISIVTRDPSFKATGNAEVSYGSFNELRTRGFVSVPLSDMLAVSVSGIYAHSSGYYNDLLRGGKAGGIDSVAIRGKVLFRPSDSFDMLFSASWIDNDEPGQLTYQPYQGHAPNNTTSPLPTRPWDIAPDTLPTMKTTMSTFALRTRYMSDTVTVTSNTSYTKPHTRSITDADSGPQLGNITDVDQHAKSFQQEIQVATNFDGMFNVIGGLFYLDSDHDFNPAKIFNASGTNIYRITTNVATQSWAVFGEARVKLTEQLTVIGGLRYSWEEKTLTGAIGTTAPPPVLIGRKSWDALTPRISVQYAVKPQTNVYFTYSKGFKSGAWDSTTLSPNPVQPENLNSYEIGLKSRVNDWLDVDIAAYHYKLKNLQVQIIRGLISSLENAAGAKMDGIDFNASARVSSDLQLNLGAAWLRARYTDFTAASSLFWNSTTRANVATSANVTGNQVIRSPELTLSAAANYTRDIGTGKLDGSLNVYYSSSFSHVPAGNVSQDAYALIDGQLGYTLENGIRLGVWAKNLTNKAVANAVLQNGVSDRISYMPPRSFGGMVSFRF